MLHYFKIILRGVGQVMLQNNALTGLIFLIGIFYNSWIMGLVAIAGTTISTTSAIFLKYSKEDIKNGLFGFNGTLVGIAVFFYFGVSVYSFLAVIIGAILSTVIMKIIKKTIPAFTAPFVISTWIMMLGMKLLNITPFHSSPLPLSNSLNLFSTAGMGIGQVMFQGSAITGIIFLIAILINSRMAATYAFYGSVVGGLFATLLALPLNMINMGLFGYNAVLCSIAIGIKKWTVFIMVTLAIILSVLLNYSLGRVGITTLTAPFVIATWIILLIEKIFNSKYVKN